MSRSTSSRGDDSSDNETISAGEQAAWILWSHFDCEGDNPKSTNGIPMKTRSRRRHSIEMTSISSESRIVSSKASSWCRPAPGRGASGRVM